MSEDERTFRKVDLSTEAIRRVEPATLDRGEQVVFRGPTESINRAEVPILQFRPSVLVTPGDGTGGRN